MKEIYRQVFFFQVEFERKNEKNRNGQHRVGRVGKRGHRHYGLKTRPAGEPESGSFSFFLIPPFDFFHFGIIFQWQMKKTFAAFQRPIT